VPPALNRSHYGLLLNGRPEDETNGVAAIPPIFHQSFSKEKNLRSWAICGVVPCTRHAINHHTARHKLEPSQLQSDATPEKIYAEVILEYRNDNYDWASKKMKELETLNHASCQWLQEKGYNAKVLKIKANV
jgi:hypothetical protein